VSNFDFVIKRGDLLPVITATLKDANGAAVDLTGTAVKLLMKKVGGTSAKVNATATVDPDQVTNKGKVSYAWVGTDTDTGGVYEAEWEVTFAGGKKQTFPNPEYLVVRITGDLG